MRRHLIVVIATVLCLSLAQSAAAQVFEWTTQAGGNFRTATNWTPAGPPDSSGETARFGLPNTYTVTFIGSESFGTLIQAAGNITFQLNGWTLQPVNTTNNVLGAAGGTSLHILSGNFRPGGYIIGSTAGSSGTLLLDQASHTTLGSGAFHVGSSGTGNVTLQAGSTLTTANSAIIAANVGSVGAVSVIGTGSTWTANTTMRIGQAGNGTLSVANGGTVTSSALELGEAFNSVGILNVSGGGTSFTTTGTANIGGVVANQPAASATINLSTGALVALNGTTNLRTGATINMNGGTLSLNTLNWAPGAKVNWSAGAVRFANGTGITQSVLQLFLNGTSTLGTNRTLAATAGVLNLDTNLDLAGGKLNIHGLQLNANLNVGAFSSMTATDTITIQPGRTLQIDDFGSISATTSIVNNGGVLKLNGPLANVNSLMTNTSGVIQGSGRFVGGLNNGASGTIRAAANDHIVVQGAAFNNPGMIELLSGTVEYTGTLTNTATGFISGRGVFRGSSATPGGNGLINLGVLAFSAGHTDVYGDVQNDATGRIVAAGGSVVTFYDDVVNNGDIRTNVGSRSVFFGDVTGAGAFTGGGDVELNGDLRPGNSPANVSFGGNVVISPTAGLEIELAGKIKGAAYDALTIAGAAALSGALNVSLLAGYVPRLGDVFEILTAGGGIDGTFDSEALPALGGGLLFDVIYEPQAVKLAVIGTPGDYNYDGAVDAADYIMWRKTAGQNGSGLPADGNQNGTVDPDDNNVWEDNYGQPNPPGSGSGQSAATPEPASIALLIIALAFAPRIRASQTR
jgi:fibronectin-binding autotransporter adhesin